MGPVRHKSEHWDRDRVVFLGPKAQEAGIPIWFPLQLRHAAGTLIRKKYGLEASQAVLGHAELSVTQVYSEVDLQTARKVMAEIG